MGLLEPDYVDEPEPEYRRWVCLDCAHKWIPTRGRWELDEERYYWSPDGPDCPACGSSETDEHYQELR